MNFVVWNKACVVRHVWNVLISSGSLWVAWVQRYRIKQKSFWDLKEGAAGSWVWKRLLRCRSDIQHFVSNQGDLTLWDGEPMARYSVKRAWDSLRLHDSPVGWFELVWSKEVVHRHGIILWLAILGRLRTQDKLLAWGKPVSGFCVFYPGGIETCCHIFYACPFMQAIVTSCVASLAPVSGLGTWEEVIDWCASEWKGKSSAAVACRAVWSLAVSLTWRERCARLYGVQSVKTPGILCREVGRVLKWRAEIDFDLQKSLSAIRLGCL
ncbi:unnamed protein product [Linum trigynum]|uniref:Reverse transcriptase zinc-binding domain-containing protein n=1 Tax=Linum trigynum TaxID=586398 RepID=A0AAV2DD05_9ROSI